MEVYKLDDITEKTFTGKDWTFIIVKPEYGWMQIRFRDPECTPRYAEILNSNGRQEHLESYPLKKEKSKFYRFQEYLQIKYSPEELKKIRIRIWRKQVYDYSPISRMLTRRIIANYSDLVCADIASVITAYID